MTDATEAARRIVAAADHYLASGKAHGFTSATAEQAAECYTAVIEKDADVVARALLAGHDDKARIAALEAENARLQDRLEMRHVWQFVNGEKVRVEVEPGSIPDGIECRDETIRQQDKSLRELMAENARLRLLMVNMTAPKRMNETLAEYMERRLAAVDEARAALEAGNG